MKKRYYILLSMILVMTAMLCGCMQSTPNASKLKQDLEASDFQSSLSIQSVSDIDSFAILPYTISKVDITKRDTIGSEDTVWFDFTADNSAVQYTGSATAYYHKYSEGGWMLESFALDSYEASPIAPPSAADCIVGWDEEWAYIAEDIYLAEITLQDYDISAAIPNAALTYTGRLTDGGASYIDGTNTIWMEFWPDIGWKCTNLDITSGISSTSSSFTLSTDITGTYVGDLGYYSIALYITDVSPDGLISGYMQTNDGAIYFSNESQLGCSVYGAYASITLDSSDPEYREVLDKGYVINISPDGVSCDNIQNFKKW